MRSPEISTKTVTASQAPLCAKVKEALAGGVGGSGGESTPQIFKYSQGRLGMIMEGQSSSRITWATDWKPKEKPKVRNNHVTIESIAFAFFLSFFLMLFLKPLQII